MKKMLFALGVLALSLPSLTSAQITNLKVVAGSDGKDVFIDWSPLSDSKLFAVEGYAIMWDKNQDRVRRVDTGNVKQFIRSSQNFINVRSATFDTKDSYTMRICSYIKEGRQTILSNCSKGLKFKLDSSRSGFAEEPEEVTINDPVIADNDVDDVFDFGKLRAVEYDTYVMLTWSRANLSSSDADGLVIAISEKEDMSDPIVELEAGLDITSGKIEGLKPESTYYAQGSFYKNRAGEKQKFGSGTKETLTMRKAFTEAQKARLERLQKRRLVRNRALVTARVPGSDTETTSNDTSSSDTTSATTTNNSTSTSNTTTTTTTRNTSATHSRAEIEKKIRELEAELARWKAKLRAARSGSSARTSTRSSSTSRTSSRSSRSNSFRERLCAARPNLGICKR